MCLSVIYNLYTSYWNFFLQDNYKYNTIIDERTGGEKVVCNRPLECGNLSECVYDDKALDCPTLIDTTANLPKFQLLWSMTIKGLTTTWFTELLTKSHGLYNS